MTAKTIIASVFITIIIISPVVYFVLPLLYPGMKEGGTGECVLLQSVIGTFSSQAVLFDENLTSTLIPDTELTITTQGNSYLAITFNSFAMIVLDILFTRSIFPNTLTISNLFSKACFESAVYTFVIFSKNSVNHLSVSEFLHQL